MCVCVCVCVSEHWCVCARVQEGFEIGACVRVLLTCVCVRVQDSYI